VVSYFSGDGAQPLAGNALATSPIAPQPGADGAARQSLPTWDAAVRARGMTTIFYYVIAVLMTTFALHAADVPVSAPGRIELASPLDYSIVQRATRDGGNIIIAGTIIADDGGTADALEVSITGKSLSGYLADSWQPLPYRPGDSTFHTELPLAAGGWYRLRVRALRRGVPLAAASVEHVGLGEIFVIAGQSNSANYGEERQTPKTGLVAAFNGHSWQPANDPQPGAGGDRGSFMPPFGDAMAARYQVPIGIVALGIGATSVREWLPAGTRLARPPTIMQNVTSVGLNEWEATGAIFANFARRMKQLGPHGFRAVLWHQGESDAHQKDPGRTLPGELYRQYLKQLIHDSRQVIGWNAPWFVAQASYHTPDDASSPEIREAQRALWTAGVALPGPDTDSLTGDMRENHGKGVHLSAKGLARHGNLWAEKVGVWLDAELDK